ncbi:MAG: PepSY-associated TM helix domain-containing protein [Bacteroidota bacterium]
MYDRYSRSLLKVNYWDEQNGGERIMRLNYPIHLGLIGGLPKKILAFIASLVGVSLPVTGFLIWYGRNKKKRRLNLPYTHLKQPSLGQPVVVQGFYFVFL